MTIETFQIDGYVQSVMSEPDMSVRDRSRNAAAAIAVHVMTEHRLPLTTTLVVPERDVVDAEENLSMTHSVHGADITAFAEDVRRTLDLIPEAEVVEETPTEFYAAMSDEELAEHAEQEKVDAFMDRERTF